MKSIIFAATSISIILTSVMLCFSKKTIDIAKYFIATVVLLCIALITFKVSAPFIFIIMLIFSEASAIFIFIIKIQRKLK